MWAWRCADDGGGQATMATIEYHPVDPCLSVVQEAAMHRGVHAPLQAHPCVEACRASMSTLLYNSCLIQQSTSARSSLISPGNVLEDSGRRQSNGRHPTETGNLLFKDTILAYSASAIIQLLPHVRLQEQGVVARPTRERSALQGLA